MMQIADYKGSLAIFTKGAGSLQQLLVPFHPEFDDFTACPAAFAETNIRAAVGSRKPRPQDAFDLMHIVPALAYCAVFVSNDGPLRKQAEEASRRMGRAMTIVATLKDMVAA